MPDRPLSPSIDLDMLRALLIGPYRAAIWANVIGSDCHLRIGNAPVVMNLSSCLETLEQLLQPGRSIGLTYWEGWRRGVTLFAETELTIPTTSTPLIIPCVVIARVLNGKIRDLRFYLDLTPSANLLN